MQPNAQKKIKWFILISLMIFVVLFTFASITGLRPKYTHMDKWYDIKLLYDFENKKNVFNIDNQEYFIRSIKAAEGQMRCNMWGAFIGSNPNYVAVSVENSKGLIFPLKGKLGSFVGINSIAVDESIHQIHLRGSDGGLSWDSVWSYSFKNSNLEFTHVYTEDPLCLWWFRGIK